MCLRTFALLDLENSRHSAHGRPDADAICRQLLAVVPQQQREEVGGWRAAQHEPVQVGHVGPEGKSALQPGTVRQGEAQPETPSFFLGQQLQLLALEVTELREILLANSRRCCRLALRDRAHPVGGLEGGELPVLRRDQGATCCNYRNEIALLACFCQWRVSCLWMS